MISMKIVACTSLFPRTFRARRCVERFVVQQCCGASSPPGSPACGVVRCKVWVSFFHLILFEVLDALLEDVEDVSIGSSQVVERSLECVLCRLRGCTLHAQVHQPLGRVWRAVSAEIDRRVPVEHQTKAVGERVVFVLQLERRIGRTFHRCSRQTNESAPRARSRRHSHSCEGPVPFERKRNRWSNPDRSGSNPKRNGDGRSDRPGFSGRRLVQGRREFTPISFWGELYG